MNNQTCSPNGGAFISQEQRTGPPLMYVSEKIKCAVQQLHSLYHLAKRDVPGNLPVPERFAGHPEFAEYNVKIDSVTNPCGEAFRFALIAFLALNNLLAIANQEGIVRKLLDLSPHNFDKWLVRIEEEGSVT